MIFLGKWKNQFGSVVAITEYKGDEIRGEFKTALRDSAFYGKTVPIFGVAKGNCISFSSVGSNDNGDFIVAYTGLLRDGRMETLWYYAADQVRSEGELIEAPWWKAMIANADTFERLP